MFAEMESGGAAIMLGHPGPDYRSPKAGGADLRLRIGVR